MVDIFTMKVFQDAIIHIANEMGVVMMRSSYSPIFSEVHDFSCAIHDQDGLLVGEGLHLLQHTGSMEETTTAVVRYFKEEGLGIYDGDIIFSNHTYIGGTHLPEINVYAPVFYDEELMFLPGVRAHHSDVGGAAIGSTYMHATEIQQEGLIIPPVKIYDRGEFRKDLFKLIVSCSRTPELFEGDLKAEIAGARIARKRLIDLTDKYGKETIKECIHELAHYSEKLVRDGISKIKDGAYEADHYMDDDGVLGHPIKMHVKVTVRGSDIEVDFDGSDPQTPGPVNIPYAAVRSGVYSGIFFMTLPEVKSNTGCYRPIKIKIPENSFIGCKYPAPTIIMNDTYQRIHDVIVYALAPARPEKAYAGCVGSTCTTYLAGNDPRKNNSFYLLPFFYVFCSGWGAHSFKDGKSCTGPPVCGSAIRNMPIEVLETKFPYRINKYEMVPDSGGPGKYRGGLGGVIEAVPLEHNARLTQQFQSVRCPPYGLFGGKSGRPAQCTIAPGTPDEKVLPPMISGVTIPKETVYRQVFSGGGGWGDPYERAVDAVLDDLKKGYISVKGAREDYGVVVDSKTFEVNTEATRELRKQKG